MAKLQCKMCGGDLSFQEGSTVAECNYCGSVQTVPNVDNEKKLTLFARANRLRSGCEFDKAAGVYESIVAEFPQEAEAYWGLVLCKYGIEYVDDPGTGKKVPTCHRSSFESVRDDSDLEQALENADVVARKVYREEAKQIEELRKGIIAVSANEQPYDIFICYKETGSDGERTLDSVLAQDLYDTLTGKDYRVFFSRISLEDKLGLEYEPYIFAALNSSKIMLAVGTDYEHYQGVWVKNEWSRYLKLMAKDKDKHLIPCYKGIDPYDLPREFAKLQAQDLGKVGAVQDLLRGIEKLLPKKASAPVERVIVQQGPATPGATSLLRRGELFLGDGDWNSAHTYFDKVLDIQPECAEAYLGKLMANYGVRKKEDLKNLRQSFEKDLNYQKAVAFGDEGMRNFLMEAVLKVQKTQERLAHERQLEQERLIKEQQEQDRLAAEAREQRRLHELECQKTRKKCRRRNGLLTALLWISNALLLMAILALLVTTMQADDIFLFQEAYFNGETEETMMSAPVKVTEVWMPSCMGEVMTDIYGLTMIIFAAVALKGKTQGRKKGTAFTVVTLILGIVFIAITTACFVAGIVHYDFAGVLKTLPENLKNIGKAGYSVYGFTAIYILSQLRLLVTVILPIRGKMFRAP